MSTILNLRCPHCNEEIQAPANVQAACPECGELVIAEERLSMLEQVAPGTPRWQLVLLAVLVPVMALMMWQQFAGRERPMEARHTLDSGGAGSTSFSQEVKMEVKAKECVRLLVRDPSKVTYHGWRHSVNDTTHIAIADLTTMNGFGGPKREKWAFSFDRLTGQLRTLLVNGKEVALQR